MSRYLVADGAKLFNSLPSLWLERDGIGRGLKFSLISHRCRVATGTFD